MLETHDFTPYVYNSIYGAFLFFLLLCLFLSTFSPQVVQFFGENSPLSIVVEAGSTVISPPFFKVDFTDVEKKDGLTNFIQNYLIFGKISLFVFVKVVYVHMKLQKHTHQKVV